MMHPIDIHRPLVDCLRGVELVENPSFIVLVALDDEEEGQLPLNDDGVQYRVGTPEEGAAERQQIAEREDGVLLGRSSARRRDQEQSHRGRGRGRGRGRERTTNEGQSRAPDGDGEHFHGRGRGRGRGERGANRRGTSMPPPQPQAPPPPPATVHDFIKSLAFAGRT